MLPLRRRQRRIEICLPTLLCQCFLFREPLVFFPKRILTLLGLAGVACVTQRVMAFYVLFVQLGGLLELRPRRSKSLLYLALHLGKV
jgi:hypothetical protein